MNYAEIKRCDIANGPGVGVALFVSGCDHHCYKCFNQETWDYNFGKPFTNHTMDTLMSYLDFEYIKRLTILGGDPICSTNKETVSNIVITFRETYGIQKSLWLYTGYTYEELIDMHNKDVNIILENIDVLVDGRYMEEQRDLSLKFRGSHNQRIIDMKETRKTGNIVLSKYQ